MTLILNSTEEIKQYVSFIHNDIRFENFKTDILLAQNEIIELVGQDVFDLANIHDSGSGGIDDVDQLTEKMKLATALLTYLRYAQNHDVSHGSEGRRATINNEQQKMAWEWMIDRDNAAMVSKANESLDDLIKYLDNNEDVIPEWKDSDAKKTARKLFINNAAEFSQIQQIDRVFYLRVIAYINQAEVLSIEPVLTTEVFDTLKLEFEENNTLSDEKLLLRLRMAIVPLVMRDAFNRMSIALIPGGASIAFTSDQKTSKASEAAKKELIDATIVRFNDEANKRLQDLSEYVKSKEEGEEYIPSKDPQVSLNEATNKSFNA